MAGAIVSGLEDRGVSGVQGAAQMTQLAPLRAVRHTPTTGVAAVPPPGAQIVWHKVPHLHNSMHIHYRGTPNTMPHLQDDWCNLQPCGYQSDQILPNSHVIYANQHICNLKH